MKSTLAGRPVASAFLFADVESEGQRLSVRHWPNPTTARVRDVATVNRNKPPGNQQQMNTTYDDDDDRHGMLESW